MTKTLKVILTTLSVLGLLAWGAAVFTGAHFYQIGSYTYSVPVALASVLLMGLFLWLAVRFAQPKARGDFGRSAVVRKYVFLGLYVLASLASSIFVVQAVYCTTSFKEEARPKALAALEDLQQIVNEAPGAKGSYMDYVDTQMANYRSANPRHLTDARDLQMEIDNLRTELVANSGYPQLRKKAMDAGQAAQGAIEAWNIFDLPKSLKVVSEELPVWEKEFGDISKNGAKANPEWAAFETFTPAISDAQGMDGYMFLRYEYYFGVPLLVILVLQLLIMMSWVAVSIDTTKRAKGVTGLTPNVTSWQK